MAKISARGDREVARWGNRSDWLVLTEQGRLLRKRWSDSTYHLVRPRQKWDRNTAGAQAAMFGLAPAAVRT